MLWHKDSFPVGEDKIAPFVRIFCALINSKEFLRQEPDLPPRYLQTPEAASFS